jgi:hypothetical protein
MVLLLLSILILSILGFILGEKENDHAAKIIDRLRSYGLTVTITYPPIGLVMVEIASTAGGQLINHAQFTAKREIDALSLAMDYYLKNKTAFAEKELYG